MPKQYLHSMGLLCLIELKKNIKDQPKLIKFMNLILEI
jgi:hypothetical protein